MIITIPKTTKSWSAMLLLIVAFAVFASNADAQSRGRTEGRKEQTRKPAPKKAAPKQKSTSNRSSSNSRASSRQSSGRGGSGSEASKGSKQSSRATQSRGSSRSTANTQSRSGSRSTANTQSRNSSQRNTQSSRGSSQSSRNAQSSRGSSQSNRNAQSSRGSSQSSRGSSGSSGSRTRQSSGNTSTRGDATRIGNGQSNGEKSTTTRGDTRRSGNTSSTRQQSSRGTTSAARGSTSRASRGTSTDREAASRRNGNSRGAQNNRGANASDRARRGNRGTKIQPVPYNARYKTAARRYHNKRYVYRPHHKRNYNWRPPVYHHRPHVQVNVVWPWQNRYHRQWRPHYQYRQVVYVEVGWGGNRRQARVDVRTNYHQQVKYADHRKAVVDIWLDEIEVYQEGYYVGRVKRIPDHLAHIEATIYRNGDVVFDRDVFIVGDKRSGFEMISTRQYDGYVMDHYRRGDDMEVGKLNFRRKRVDSRRYSQLFDPYNFRGFAPISLLPEDRNLVADFGYESLSYGYYDDQNDPYYGGGYGDDYYDYDEYGNVYQYDRPDAYGYDSSYSVKPTNRLSVQAIAETKKPLTGRTSNQYKTKQGIAIKYERESELQRIR